MIRSAFVAFVVLASVVGTEVSPVRSADRAVIVKVNAAEYTAASESTHLLPFGLSAVRLRSEHQNFAGSQRA